MKQLGIDPIKIKPKADFGKELIADSLDVVELVMVIENEFEINIEDQIASQILWLESSNSDYFSFCSCKKQFLILKRILYYSCCHIL